MNFSRGIIVATLACCLSSCAHVQQRAATNGTRNTTNQITQVQYPSIPPVSDEVANGISNFLMLLGLRILFPS